MGTCSGRGGGAGGASAGNILQFPQKSGGWDAPGNKQRLDDLEKTLNNAKSDRTVERVYSALRNFDRSITTQINFPDEYDDVKVLTAQRRRGRQMMRRIERMK